MSRSGIRGFWSEEQNRIGAYSVLVVIAALAVLITSQRGLNNSKEHEAPQPLRGLLIEWQAAFPCPNDVPRLGATEAVCVRGAGDIANVLTLVETMLSSYAKATTEWEVIEGSYVKHWMDHTPAMLIVMVGSTLRGEVRVTILRVGSEDGRVMSKPKGEWE